MGGGTSGIQANAWTWVDFKDGSSTSKIRLTLTTGSHNIKFVGKQSGVALDKVMFVQDGSCVPADLGDNCATTSDNAGPAIDLTSPTANQEVSGTVNIQATAKDNPGGSNIAKVEFYVDKTLISTASAEPYSASWDSTKTPNGSHVVIARAYDAAGSSADSQVQVTVKNGDTSLNPDAPTGLAATDNGTSVGLTWKAPASGTVSSYHVIRDDQDLASVPGTSTTYTDSKVEKGKSYTYTVVAVDASGNQSDPSNEATVTVGGNAGGSAPVADSSQPSAPANLRGSAAGPRQINLSWADSIDNVGVAGYEVYQVNGTKEGTGEKIATIGDTSFGVTGLQPSTAYTFYVVAKDAAGNRSPESARVTVTTAAAGRAGLPSTGPGGDSLGLTGPGGIKGSINLKVSGGRVVVWINGTKRIFSLDSNGNYNVAGLPRGVYSIKYTLRNYRVSFLWLKVDEGVTSQNVSLRQ